MIEYIYIPIILLLYLRTWKYFQLIDDFVPRGGYLLILGDKPKHPSFYDKRRPIMATVTNIGIFTATCFVIHHLWGWKAALLYAVFPLNVSGVAWSTGNYYMSTVFLILTSYFFFFHFEVLPIIHFPLQLTQIFSIIIYVAALGSTVSAIPFAFWLPLAFLPYTSFEYWIFFIPLLFFLFGHRFTTGLKLRKEKHRDIYIQAGIFRWRTVFLMVKIVAYYAFLSLWPSRLGMWHDFHRIEAKKGLLGSPSRLFWLSCLMLLFLGSLGWQNNWAMTLWWLFFIGIFSQFVSFGMMIAERYTHVANVGFCVLVSYLPTELLIVVATLWFARSWIYIKTYKHNRDFFLAGANAFPDTPENYMNYANCYLEHKNPYKAIEPLLRADKICDGKNSGINQNLASCYYDCKDYGKARHYIEKALENCQQTNRAKLLDWMEKLEKKVEVVQENREILKEKGIL